MVPFSFRFGAGSLPGRSPFSRRSIQPSPGGFLQGHLDASTTRPQPAEGAQDALWLVTVT